MKGLAENLKALLVMAVVLMLAGLSTLRLMKIQIMGDKDIAAPTPKYEAGSFTYTKEVKATRGEIIDYSGNTIVTNNTHTDIVLQKAFFTDDLQEGNRQLLSIYYALKDCGHSFEESIPITFEQPYTFTDDDPSKVISNLKLNVYATAENCIDKLISDNKIDDSYTDEEKRIIAGMRYEMIAKDFAYSNDLILAKDVDSQTVITMKELSNLYRGIEAVESSDREIVRGDILPHEIGTVGPIYAEEYDDLKDEGYSLNDTLGKSGIESALETELRGTVGEEEITVRDGLKKNIKEVSETTSGSTVKLTVDGGFQLRLQEILDDFLLNFNSINTNPKLGNVHCGAIAVLDAKTGAVKGMATAPTYNLKDYSENYDYFADLPDSPLINRCTYGLYRPGSTFKTITATAGLNEGVVLPGTVFYCHQGYEYHGSHFSCTGNHGSIAIRRAIEVSCNSYFYELSDKLGIDNITKYANLYGLGQSTGIETGDAPGYLCNPETFEEHGQEWRIGYVIQAGIGNQDCGMTPLQMASVAATIGNRGVRYKPYIVDSLYQYGTDKQISKTQPTVAQQIPLSFNELYDSIIGGMIDASHNVPATYSLSNLGFDVAIKTGTPQKSSDLNKQNSFFIGFAPADNPEIAFAGVIEDGEYSKYMIRDIILAYQEYYGLNGKKAKKHKLPEENRPELTAPATTTGTTTTSTTTASSHTTTTFVITEAPEDNPYASPLNPVIPQNPIQNHDADVQQNYDPNVYENPNQTE